MPAKDTMVVFVNGEEVPGFLLYGIFPAGADPWPSELPAQVLADRYDLDGVTWRVCIWTVRVTDWVTRAEWQAAVSRLLTSIIEQGAQVSWLASEGAAFVNPPWLFHPAKMSGGVYAYLTATGRYACPVDTGQLWTVVADQELQQLRLEAPLSRADDSAG